MSNKQLLDSPQIIWEAPQKTVLAGEGPKNLTGPWKLMLLGDGSPTRHLHLLTGYEVTVELIAMESEQYPYNGNPLEVMELNLPLLKRQVWLKCGSKILAWAESWWNENEVNEHLKNKDQPIWKSLTQGRSELFREVDGLALVNAEWLQEKFHDNGPFWSRHYRFFKEQRAITVIREVFSPELEKWLGKAPRQI